MRCFVVVLLGLAGSMMVGCGNVIESPALEPAVTDEGDPPTLPEEDPATEPGDLPTDEVPIDEPTDEPPPDEPPDEQQPEEPIQASCPRVRVNDIGSDPLNVRPQPNRSQAPIATLGSFDIVDVLSLVEGESIDGDTRWFEVAVGDVTGFASAIFVACTFDEAPSSPAGFLLPFACNQDVPVTQGNNSAFSHNGTAAFAFDFGVPLDTNLHAIESGVVSWAFGGIDPGEACYNGGGSECANNVNYVAIDHGDGTNTLYLHLNEALVSVGEIVNRGDVVALSGGSGWSTGPHTHIQRQENCNSWWCQSVPMTFADVGYAPASGDNVRSQNSCPAGQSD